MRTVDSRSASIRPARRGKLRFKPAVNEALCASKHADQTQYRIVVRRQGSKREAGEKSFGAKQGNQACSTPLIILPDSGQDLREWYEVKLRAQGAEFDAIAVTARSARCETQILAASLVGVRKQQADTLERLVRD